MARLSSGKPLVGPVSALNSSTGTPVVNLVTSNVGNDAIATTDESLASRTTAEPPGAEKFLSTFLKLLSRI